MKRFLNRVKTAPFRWAYRLMVRSLKRDKELADVWQSNIAMPIYDGAKGRLSPEEANKIADYLMFHLFEVRQ